MSEPATETKERGGRKRAVGIVVSDKCDKTITVRVNRTYKHPRYGKYMSRSTKFTAHDEKNDAREGDQVEIMETRPLSKMKRWRLLNVVERAKG